MTNTCHDMKRAPVADVDQRLTAVGEEIAALSIEMAQPGADAAAMMPHMVELCRIQSDLRFERGEIIRRTFYR
jgi:hypothetical protein